MKTILLEIIDKCLALQELKKSINSDIFNEDIVNEITYKKIAFKCKVSNINKNWNFKFWQYEWVELINVRKIEEHGHQLSVNEF